ncbi:MAG: hypothetical protein EXR53_05550, partial [Dehalococcoidia bacterium]|nr:hypothetical protein [Dehalococcoidia bacterium]
MEEVTVEEQQPQAAVEAAQSAASAQELQPTQASAPAVVDLGPALAEARSVLQERDASLAEVRGVLAQRDVELQTLRHQLVSATAHYRQALLAAAPEIPEELVSGNSPEEVEASMARARQMVERIRSRIEAQIAEQRLPTGAPIRSVPDISCLSAQEKIAYALLQQRGVSTLTHCPSPFAKREGDQERFGGTSPGTSAHSASLRAGSGETLSGLSQRAGLPRYGAWSRSCHRR